MHATAALDAAVFLPAAPPLHDRRAAAFLKFSDAPWVHAGARPAGSSRRRSIEVQSLSESCAGDRTKKKGGPCGPPFVMLHGTSMDQKRWVYFMYRKRPMSKPP